MPSDIPSAVSYTSAASLTMIGGLSINEWAAVVGICLGIATFGFNIYWKVKHTERRQFKRGDS